MDSKGRGLVVAYDVPVRYGEVLVQPGGLVFSDFDGVVIISKIVEDQVFILVQEKASMENISCKELLEGRSLREVYDKYGVL